jgi:hypothetical protein
MECKGTTLPFTFFSSTEENELVNAMLTVSKKALTPIKTFEIHQVT